MKKIIKLLFVSTIIFPLFAHAENIQTTASTTVNATIFCKKEALIRRETTMRPVLRAYQAKSQEITDKEKNQLEGIKWYIGSNYETESKKIKEQRDLAMEPLLQKVAEKRRIAQATWRAEESLCDFNATKKATTTKIRK